ncbi:MAG: zinc metallopeptidase [Clostridia bacterium]|nr:zinc metallopeptidase [Clostridia bacterium]
MYGYYGSTDSIYLIALLLVFVVSIWAQGRVQKVFNRYANVPTAAGLSAERVAQALLSRAGSSAQITPVQGSLTDHFNPKTGVVGLSEQVYGSSSVSAVAVAAHEIGHVIQYQEGYGPIRLRNAILPVAAIGSRLAPWIVILGVVFSSFNLAMAGVILFGAMLVFQLATLPVEFNASGRALRMLEEGNYISYEESDAAKKVLRAAAMTYVLAALASFITFLRLLSIAGRSRRD